MRDYFSLQFTILNRQLDEFGIKPVIGYIAVALLFSGFTLYLWYATSYAPYIYTLTGLSLTGLLADAVKINFIRQHFPKNEFMQIRMAEHFLTISPFLSGLLLHEEWLMAVVMIASAVMLSVSSFIPSVSMVIPTPFSRYPFEFPIGFRKNLIALLLAGFLLIMAIAYTNANLGLFACALVMLLCLTFYMSAEPSYLVWIYNRHPSDFLLLKIRNALLSVTLLLLPFAITLMIVFPSHSLHLMIIYILGLLYLITAILGKYAFYPSAMNLPQGFVMALSFWFPPLLLFLIPYFYRRSLLKLQPYLS